MDARRRTSTRITGCTITLRSNGRSASSRARPDEFQHEGNIGVDPLLALLERLATQDGVTELMCHPGEADESMVKRSGYARERAIELATLTDPRARAAIKDLNITLATFADL